MNDGASERAAGENRSTAAGGERHLPRGAEGGDRVAGRKEFHRRVPAVLELAELLENIHVVDNKYQLRIGETVEFIYDLNSGAEAMRIGYDLLRQGKRVEFVSTGAVIARALVEKASKLSKSDNSPVRACTYYRDMNGK